MGAEYVRHRVYLDVIAGELWIAEDAAGELYFPVRPSCAALEVDSVPTLQRIKADSRLAGGLRKIRLPSSHGEQEQQCLASTEYAWWLALIDPRRFKTERRAVLEERQRALMSLAKEIMLQRGSVPRIAPGSPRHDGSGRRSVEVSGEGVEARMRCQRCGAPHLIVIDGAGWHVHLGVETEL